MDFLIFLAHILFFFGDLHPVKGRGHLIDPPMRSSLWRYYPWNQMGVPKNADDTGLNCGGFWRLHEINNGSCGVCGDPYDQNRRNEAGGIYANGYIVRKYYQDDEFLNVTVDILTNIGGYFEFHLCPNNNVSETINQECLDKYPLTIEGYGSKYVPNNPGEHNLFLKIPDGVTCAQCVLQWKWVGGNNWGTCEDGYGGLGCGKQEEYYNCADVAILPPSANRTRSARPGYLDRKYLFTTTTQNPMMPILPPFIRRSEKFKKFYKKYLEKVMNGMVAGKWSDNAVSRLDYNLEKQKRTNQSKQNSYWVPNRISDFRLTGQYPDSSMPSLSINVPDSFKGKTEYSFLDVVRNSLKFGNFDSNFKSLEVNDFVTGRPVYLPEATLNMPLPPTQTIAPLTPAPITVSSTTERPTTRSLSQSNFLHQESHQFVYSPWSTAAPQTTQSPVINTIKNTPAAQPRTKAPSTTASSVDPNRVMFPDFDYEQIRANRIIAQRIPYSLHRSALQTPINPVTSFLNSIFNVFAPSSVDYMSENPFNYDSTFSDVMYPNYANDILFSSVDPQSKFGNNVNKKTNNLQSTQEKIIKSTPKDVIKANSNGLLSANAPKANSFISRGLSSGTVVQQSGNGRISPVVNKMRNQPDISTRQLSNSDGNPVAGLKDSTMNRLRFSGNMFL